MKVYLLMEEYMDGYDKMETVVKVYASKEKADKAAQRAREFSIKLEIAYGDDQLFYYVDEREVIE